MTALRKHLAAWSALTALSIVLASLWIARLDHLAAQPADGQKPAGKKDEAPTDLAVFKVLDTVISVDFKNDTTLQRALTLLNEKTGGRLNIVVDEPALKDANIDPATHIVILKSTRSSVRSILKKMLDDVVLGYYLADGGLRVTSAAKAQEEVVVKFYPVAKLVSDPKQFGTSYSRKQSMKENANNLASILMNTVEPKYWHTNGGPGQIDWDGRRAALVVKASTEIHLMLAERGLTAAPWLALPIDPDTRITKVYDIGGLLDPKKLERSSEELMKTLNLVMAMDEPRRPPLKWLPAGGGMGMGGMGMGGMGMGGMGMGGMGMGGMGMGGMPGMPGSNGVWIEDPMGPGCGTSGNGLGFIGGGLVPSSPPSGGGGLPITVQLPDVERPKPADSPATTPATGPPQKVVILEREPIAPIAVILPHLERLVVRQTPQVHQDIERFIADLKAAAGKAPVPK